MQRTDPGSLLEFKGHDKHPAREAILKLGLYESPGQVKQVSDAWRLLYVPGGQGSQAPKPPGPAVPGMQAQAFLGECHSLFTWHAHLPEQLAETGFWS